MSRFTERQLNNFWRKVDKTGTCWNWTGAAYPAGYGHVHINYTHLYAHRVSYELANGPIPDGLIIDHMCHNTGCVNPGHLRSATYKQNAENRIGVDRRNKSGRRGVTWHADTNKWRAAVIHHGETHTVGYFADLDEADAAVTAKRLELYTHNDEDRRKAAAKLKDVA